jgi:hypothetical protein
MSVSYIFLYITYIFSELYTFIISRLNMSVNYIFLYITYIFCELYIFISSLRVWVPP